MDTNSRYLIKSVDELVLKNSNLKDDISLLRKDNSSLKTENSSLKAEVELTRKDNEALTANIGSLKRKYDKLEDSYSGLLNKLRKWAYWLYFYKF